MKIENRIKNSLLNKKILIQKTASKSDIKKFLSRFREKYESINLIRVGSKNDGGYLVPNYLQNIEYCFSPGVADSAEFEAQLSKEFNIKSYLADASVDAAPVDDKNFKFLKKFLGSRSHGEFITLSDWIIESVPKSDSNKILQMDIEGGEYDVLTYESADLLAQFSFIIVEFHGLKNIYEKHFLRMLSAIFEKFYINFSICHVHPNNSSSIETMGDIEIPKVIEVTFIRNDLVNEFSSNEKVFLPHVLDEKNLKDLDDLIMPEIWWKKDYV
tara:strand:- start:188 stop:1000 length:813 start_codon:yes stop_codon:yes gene_type:complete